MNYLKRIGRLVAICICAVCVGIIPITAHAMEVSDKQIQPRMDYISSYGTELTISDSGEASVTGFVRGKKGVTNAYVKVTLQKKVSGSWVYVQSWESSGSGRNATIAETYSVSRGTYRVVASIKAGTSKCGSSTRPVLPAPVYWLPKVAVVKVDT